jgi:hypothetical protein
VTPGRVRVGCRARRGRAARDRGRARGPCPTEPRWAAAGAPAAHCQDLPPVSLQLAVTNNYIQRHVDTQPEPASEPASDSGPSPAPAPDRGRREPAVRLVTVTVTVTVAAAAAAAALTRDRDSDRQAYD